MKLIKSIKTVFVGILLTLTACSDFGDINVNPNLPTEPEAANLISNTIYNFGNQKMANGFSFSSVLMQYHGKPDFNEIDQYQIEANSELWVNNYNLLGGLNEVLKSNEVNPAMKAVAKVLKAVVGAQLADLYGAVPFFEAGDKDNLKPKYDSPKEIYTKANGVIDLLSQAVTTLSSDNSAIVGDVLFNGDRTKWVKLANVLQLRYLLRISEVDTSARAKMNSIFTSGKLFLKDENAVLPYLSKPNNWFLSAVRSGDFALYRLTTTVKKQLEDKEDPRIAFYYAENITKDANGNIVNREYVGIPPGSNDRKTPFSNLSGNMRAANVLQMVYTTYFEQEFILAEAALKGYISSDAKTHYENAVKANFVYRGIEMPSDYLTNATKAKWNETLKTLIVQKYLANIMNGNEAWFDYRRTGFPELKPAENNINSNLIPVRFKYPTEETFTNKSNYEKAVSALGGNTYNGKSWWDK